jgi:hypothetical protein
MVSSTKRNVHTYPTGRTVYGQMLPFAPEERSIGFYITIERFDGLINRYFSEFYPVTEPDRTRS